MVVVMVASHFPRDLDHWLGVRGLEAENAKLREEMEVAAVALSVIASSGCDQASNVLAVRDHLRRHAGLVPIAAEPGEGLALRPPFTNCPDCGTSTPPCPSTVRSAAGCSWFTDGG